VETPREPGWRQVIVLAAAIVVGVLAIQVIAQLVPFLDDAFRRFPTVIIVMITVTAALVVVALRPRSPRQDR
jgi:hypothetical protein